MYSSTGFFGSASNLAVKLLLVGGEAVEVLDHLAEDAGRRLVGGLVGLGHLAEGVLGLLVALEAGEEGFELRR